MNLHGIAAPYVGAVNPQIPVSVRFSDGYTKDSSFKQVPAYSAPVPLLGQVQPITTRDLMQLEGINLGGVRWKIYLSGELDAVVRVERKGGDLVTISTGRHQGVWLVVQVIEQFPDWCCAAIAQQDGS